MFRVLTARLSVCMILFLVLDIVVRPHIAIAGFAPIFLYALVIYTAFEWDVKRSLMTAGFVGVLRDLTGYHPLGAETITLVGMTFLLNLLLLKIDRQSAFTRFVLAFILVHMTLLLNLFWIAIFESSQFAPAAPMRVAFGTALVTAVASGILSPFMRRWFRDRSSIKQYELFA